MEIEAILVALDVGTSKVAVLVGEVTNEGALDIIGKGTVLSSKIVAGDEEVQVRFEDAGLKLLAASFANLVVLDE